MHAKLKEVADMANLIKKMTNVDSAIAVWNKEGVVEAYFKAEKININFDVGYKDEIEDSKVKQVLRTGKPAFNILPKEVFGETFEGTLTPIFDDDGEVVGVVTYIYSPLLRNGILENADSLANSIINTDKSIEDILKNSKELSSNMLQVKDVTDTVVSKVDEAIEIVTSIKHNAKLSNILALNASIESARAGEAGKGFAVVSAEMRKFSTMSAESSEQISKSLNEIVASLQDVKNSIDLSKSVADQQTDSVNDLNNVFRNVNAKANETIELCKKVNAL